MKHCDETVEGLIKELLSAPSHLALVQTIENYLAIDRTQVLALPPIAEILRRLLAISPLEMDSSQWRNITDARIQLIRLERLGVHTNG